MIDLESHVEDMSKTGDSFENAIEIHANSSIVGISMEYLYLHDTFGQNAWKLERQMLVSNGDKKYDVFEIVLKDTTRKKIYFDVSAFYGKSVSID